MFHLFHQLSALVLCLATLISRQTDKVIVFDDLLAMHLGMLITAVKEKLWEAWSAADMTDTFERLQILCWFLLSFLFRTRILSNLIIGVFRELFFCHVIFVMVGGCQPSTSPSLELVTMSTPKAPRSSCHLNALLTSHYCQDWRWLLRDPVTAQGDPPPKKISRDVLIMSKYTEYSAIGGASIYENKISTIYNYDNTSKVLWKIMNTILYCVLLVLKNFP